MRSGEVGINGEIGYILVEALSRALFVSRLEAEAEKTPPLPKKTQSWASC